MINNDFNNQLMSVSDYCGHRVLNMSGSLTNYINNGFSEPVDNFEKKTDAKKIDKGSILKAAGIGASLLALGAGLFFLIKNGKISKVKDFVKDKFNNIKQPNNSYTYSGSNSSVKSIPSKIRGLFYKIFGYPKAAVLKLPKPSKTSILPFTFFSTLIGVSIFDEQKNILPPPGNVGLETKILPSRVKKLFNGEVNFKGNYKDKENNSNLNNETESGKDTTLADRNYAENDNIAINNLYKSTPVVVPHVPLITPKTSYIPNSDIINYSSLESKQKENSELNKKPDSDTLSSDFKATDGETDLSRKDSVSEMPQQSVVEEKILKSEVESEEDETDIFHQQEVNPTKSLEKDSTGRVILPLGDYVYTDSNNISRSLNERLTDIEDTSGFYINTQGNRFKTMENSIKFKESSGLNSLIEKLKNDGADIDIISKFEKISDTDVKIKGNCIILPAETGEILNELMPQHVNPNELLDILKISSIGEAGEYKIIYPAPIELSKDSFTSGYKDLVNCIVKPDGKINYSYTDFRNEFHGIV